MENIRNYARHWEDYELLDAGGGKKLERFGNIVTIRPELQAYFKSEWPFSEWNKLAHWEFAERSNTQGSWKNIRPDSPKAWTLAAGAY